MSANLSQQRSYQEAEGATPPRLDPREKPVIKEAGFDLTYRGLIDLNPPPRTPASLLTNLGGARGAELQAILPDDLRSSHITTIFK